MDATDIHETWGKGYTYGCFQALLLQRFRPAWQESVLCRGALLEEEMERHKPVLEREQRSLRSRWPRLYDSARWQTRCEQEFSGQDRCYRTALSRKGRTYVVSFNAIGYTPRASGGRKSFRLGSMQLYPAGLGELHCDQIEISGLDVPCLVHERSHLQVIDTAHTKGKPACSVQFTKREGTNVFHGAVIKTPVFTLKAPKVRISESPKRVKIAILARTSAE
jgi:hypothetical protein